MGREESGINRKRAVQFCAFLETVRVSPAARMVRSCFRGIMIWCRAHWFCGRADECTGLENQRPERVRGFESHRNRTLIIEAGFTLVAQCW